MENKDDGLILSYLLGEMKGTDREHFEERYFTDESLFDRLQSVKQELIDDYVHNRLPRAQRKQFERRFRSSSHDWEEIEFNRAFGEALQSRRQPFARRRHSNSWFGNRVIAFGMAASLLLAVGLMSLIYIQNRSLRTQLAVYESAAVTPAPAPSPPSLIDRLQLNATDLRISAGRSAPAANTEVFRVRKEAVVVEVELIWPQSSAREPYTAVLSDADGLERASSAGLSATTADGMSHVLVLFPAAYLSQGSYVIRLRDSRGQIVESFAISLRID